MCCELLLLTWPSMPASPLTPQEPGLLEQLCGPGAHLCLSPPLPGLPHSFWDLQRLGFHDGGSGAPVALDGGGLPIAPACTNGVP